MEALFICAPFLKEINIDRFFSVPENHQEDNLYWRLLSNFFSFDKNQFISTLSTTFSTQGCSGRPMFFSWICKEF